MHELLDKLMRSDTWFKTHPSDERRFYQILQEMLKDPEFDPEKMAEYLRSKTPDDELGYFDKVISRLTLQAHAVRDYLSLTGLR